jgi:hypothetical protein
VSEVIAAALRHGHHLLRVLLRHHQVGHAALQLARGAVARLGDAAAGRLAARLLLAHLPHLLHQRHVLLRLLELLAAQPLKLQGHLVGLLSQTVVLLVQQLEPLLEFCLRRAAGAGAGAGRA